ncbi:MAG: hypothetical protein U0271_19705 [Polyangiaceae bacterium]
MLSADVRFEGFTQTDWGRVLSLFRPRVASGKERDPDRPQGGIVAIHARDASGASQLRKLLHTQAGRLRLDDLRTVWPLRADELARRHNASWAIALEAGALENVMERFGAKLRRSDDFLGQTLLFANLLRDEMLAGRIDLHPARLAGMPMPTAGMIERSLDMVCPRDTSMVVGLFDAGELYTSIALRRGARGSFDWILGPDDLRRDMGLLAGDWRRDYRHLARAVERKMGKLSLGVFSEMSTFRTLEVDATPGAWARAVAIRDVILSPVPVALGIPLGLDAGRAAFSAARSIAQRAEIPGRTGFFDAVKGVLDGVTAAVTAREDHATGDETFHPLEMLRRLLSRER